MKTRKKRADIDKYDIAILSALANDTRLTTVELANEVHLSRTAVSRRIVALKNAGILKGAADVLDYATLGFSVRAHVEIDIPSQSINSLLPKLLVQPEVLNVSVIAGNDSLYLDVVATDLDHLQQFVRSLQHNGDTATKIVFSEEKSKLSLVDRMRKIQDRMDSKGQTNGA